MESSPPPTGQKLLIHPTRKSTPSRLPSTKFLFLLPKVHLSSQPTKCKFSCYNQIKTSFLAVVIVQVMLILILINDQYLQNVAFSFEKGVSGQNHSLSDCHHSIEKFPQKYPTSHPLLLSTIWKTLEKGPSLLEFVCYSKLNSTFLLTISFSE